MSNAKQRRPARKPAAERPERPVDFDPGRTLTDDEEASDDDLS